MRYSVLFILILSLSLFAQTLYFSPYGDLALTIYDPFVTTKPSHPNEIGSFKALGSNSLLQIVSVQLNQSTDLLVFSKLIGMQLVGMEEEYNGIAKIDDLQVFFRKFSLSVSDTSVRGFQVIFLKYQKGYVMTYYAQEEDYLKYLVPAILSMCSVKTTSNKNMYLSENFGYSLNLAKPFEALETDAGEIGSFVAIDGDKAGYVQIAKEKLPENLEPEQYAQFVEKNSLVRLSDYKELSRGMNMVQGNEFFWRIFEFSSQGTSYRSLQAHIVFEKAAYTLTYMSKTESFEKFILPAIYMIFSFKKI
ncbi:MAG: hypothetical protein WHT65_03995 [Pseudothermotoga sp.]